MHPISVDLRTSAQNSPALGGLAASPAQFARGSTPLLSFEPVSVLYNRHHFNCIHCIAAGRGQRYGKRCAVGLDLWNSYQADAADRGALARHEVAAPGEERSIPHGNHGDNLRSAEQ